MGGDPRCWPWQFRSRTFGSDQVSAGFAGTSFLPALRIWRVAWAAPVVVVAGWGWGRVPDWTGGYHAMLYCIWCVMQQLLFQNMVAKRIRSAMGASWKSWLLAGSLFGVVHLPNPVLMPATVFWGALSAFLFEECPSVTALGLIHFVLSTCLFWVTPVSWNHNFRSGQDTGIFIRPAMWF